MKICRTCKKTKDESEFYFAHKRDNLLKLDCKKCDIESKKMQDWRNQPTGWPYKEDIEDPEYIEDRRNLFNENGNGWWILAGVPLRHKPKEQVCND